MRRTIRAFIPRGESQYVVECVDVNVATQGRTIDEAVHNLQEAVALCLEGEDLEELGLAPDPSLLITMEIEPRRHVVAYLRADEPERRSRCRAGPGESTRALPEVTAT